MQLSRQQRMELAQNHNVQVLRKWFTPSAMSIITDTSFFIGWHDLSSTERVTFVCAYMYLHSGGY